MRRLLLSCVVLAVAALCAAPPAVRADRETAEFFADRGEKALKDGDASAAEEHFRRSLEEDEAFAPARFGLARALIAAELREDGLEELKRAVDELRAESSWKSEQQKARKLLDELDKAGAQLRKLVDAHVEELVAFARKWMKKDQDTAVRALRAALTLAPGHAKAAQMIESLGLSAKGPPEPWFDGTSNAGWIEMGPPRWKVEDGAIVGDVKDGAYIGRTERMIEGDFDVLMEARLVEEHDGPSYFAVAPAYDGRDGHYSLGLLKGKLLFQEDVDAETDREVYHANPPHEFDAADWHVYELRFRGSRVIALVDGQEIAVDESRPDARSGGFVGLKCQHCRFEVRRVEVTPR
jgi:tetratricopeptide (TPR) repeat protein